MYNSCGYNSYELIDYFGMTISFSTVCTQAKRN